MNNIEYIKSIEMGGDGRINAFLIFVKYENETYCNGFTMEIDDWEYDNQGKSVAPKKIFLEMTIEQGNRVEDFVALVRE